MTEHKTDTNIIKYKKLNSTAMTVNKTDMNITETLNSISTAEYKTNMNLAEKLSSTFTTEHKTDMNITKIKKYKNWSW